MSFHSADTTIYVNLDLPEKNGEFFVHRISDVKVDTGDELIDLLKVTLPVVIDLRDFKMYSAYVVLDGKGLLVTMPSVSHYMLHDYEEMFGLETKRCHRTEEAYTVAINNIRANHARLVKRALLLFPDGMRCSAESSATTPSSTDQKVKMVLRDLRITDKIKLGKAMTKVTQRFCPGSWVLRILDDNRRLLKLDKNEGDDDDLETAFAGMNMSSSP